MKLVISTQNSHKLVEIRQIFETLSLPIVSFSEVLEGSFDFVEDGDTFSENALKKVAPFPDRSDLIYLADDSGLVVDALGGAPGIYSARYAGPDATGTDMCQKILKELGGSANRNAAFICAIALRFPTGRTQVVSGRCDGVITSEIRGVEGFGYDPIFLPHGFDQTFAEMASEQKNQLSHRSRALKAAEGLLRAFQ